MLTRVSMDWTLFLILFTSSMIFMKSSNEAALFIDSTLLSRILFMAMNSGLLYSNSLNFIGSPLGY